MPSKADPFGIYVHWPFCLAKCPYCDFNSHVRHQQIDQARFAAAFKSELSWFAQKTSGRTVSSIYFGGGTPSLMQPETVGRILQAIAELWSVAPDVEVTIEANPTSVEARNFPQYRDAGINRVSVGIQALDDQALRMLGRQHSAKEALSAFELAAETFDRASFDMIYARVEQTTDQWRKELKAALGYAQGHMSLYQLTIEPDTRFATLFDAGKLVVPGESEALQLYNITQELTTACGFSAYEVSNHAQPGHECRHNILYWTCGEYAGVGPGAHSRLKGRDGRALAIDMVKSPELWLSLVEAHEVGLNANIVLAKSKMAVEYLLMGMRLSSGICLERYASLAGRNLDETRMNVLLEENLLTLHKPDGRLAPTPAGRVVLNALIGYLADG